MGLTLCCTQGTCMRTPDEIPVLRETLVQSPCGVFVAQQRMKGVTLRRKKRKKPKYVR